MLVLAYHRVNHTRPKDPLSVDTLCFRRQMTYLKKRSLRGVTLRQALLQEEPSHGAVITFDDGYADNYFCALPVLRELGFLATIFVVTGFIGRRVFFPWDERKRWITPTEFDFCLERKQLQELAQAGFEIGSHTVSHINLTDLSPQRAWQEITDSKKALEDIVGQSVTSFCYPRGRFDRRIKDMVAQAGYEVAVVTPGASTGPILKGDCYTIQRAGIYSGDGLLRFAFKASGVWRTVSRSRFVAWARCVTRRPAKLWL